MYVYGISKRIVAYTRDYDTTQYIFSINSNG